MSAINHVYHLRASFSTRNSILRMNFKIIQVAEKLSIDDDVVSSSLRTFFPGLRQFQRIMSLTTSSFSDRILVFDEKKSLNSVGMTPFRGAADSSVDLRTKLVKIKLLATASSPVQTGKGSFAIHPCRTCSRLYASSSFPCCAYRRAHFHWLYLWKN